MLQPVGLADFFRQQWVHGDDGICPTDEEALECGKEGDVEPFPVRVTMWEKFVGVENHAAAVVLFGQRTHQQRVKIIAVHHVGLLWRLSQVVPEEPGRRRELHPEHPENT